MVSILLTTFQMHFVDWKPFYFVLYFTEIFSYDSNLQQATNGLFNGLATSRYRALYVCA